MPKKCAFCPKPADSGEHLWSAWICRLPPFNVKAVFRTKLARENQKLRQWVTKGFDRKEKEVCESCNNGWMSDLENFHAKPCMEGVILSANPTTISPECVVSMAIYAFKLAVIGDHMNTKKKPFFSSAIRQRFRRSLSLPSGIHVWIGCLGELDRNHAVYRMNYANSSAKVKNGIRLYTFTWGVGRLILQLAAIKFKNTRLRRFPPPSIFQSPLWNQYAIPMFPVTSDGIHWPPSQHLSGTILDEFTNRFARDP
jgi:hypothetical protein